MPELSKIYCYNCGKLLLEAIGEVKKTCPKCKKDNHYFITSIGAVRFDENKNVVATYSRPGFKVAEIKNINS